MFIPVDTFFFWIFESICRAQTLVFVQSLLFHIDIDMSQATEAVPIFQMAPKGAMRQSATQLGFLVIRLAFYS